MKKVKGNIIAALAIGTLLLVGLATVTTQITSALKTKKRVLGTAACRQIIYNALVQAKVLIQNQNLVYNANTNPKTFNLTEGPPPAADPPNCTATGGDKHHVLSSVPSGAKYSITQASGNEPAYFQINTCDPSGVDSSGNCASASERNVRLQLKPDATPVANPDDLGVQRYAINSVASLDGCPQMPFSVDVAKQDTTETPAKTCPAGCTQNPTTCKCTCLPKKTTCLVYILSRGPGYCPASMEPRKFCAYWVFIPRIKANKYMWWENIALTYWNMQNDDIDNTRPKFMFRKRKYKTENGGFHWKPPWDPFGPKVHLRKQGFFPMPKNVTYKGQTYWLSDSHERVTSNKYQCGGDCDCMYTGGCRV
ncbi:MAG: hypothetical protein HY537_02120 [Deltaproteobacteria bacterium]|nr:hypothetical protein [Deltaproteobacteria bacterium]